MKTYIDIDVYYYVDYTTTNAADSNFTLLFNAILALLALYNVWLFYLSFLAANVRFFCRIPCGSD